MTILEDEDIILKDDSFIINEIKKWFGENACDIIRSKVNIESSGKYFCSIYKNLMIDIDDFDSTPDKINYLLNIDDDFFEEFIQIDLNTSPAKVSVQGKLIINNDATPIPTNLFVIDTITGGLDLTFCRFKTTDGFPEREKIFGPLWLTGNTITNNKYSNITF